MHRSARITAIAVPLAAVIALTGCSTGSGTKPASTATTSATAKAAETKTPTITIGDAIGKVENGKPVIITDEWGSYQKMTLNPDAKFYTTIPADNDGSAKQNGFSDADILDAEKWLGTFITEETLDSSVLDSKDRKLADWVAANSKYLTGSMQSIAAQQGDDANLVVSGLWNGPGDEDKIPAHTVRDSRPRASNATATFTKVRGVEDGGKPYVIFDGTTSTRYIADNKAVIEGYSMRGYTLDQVKTRFPNIDTAKPLAVQSDVTFQYALTHNGNGWAIGGYTLDTQQTLVD
ncbi:hypothetical protein ACWGJ9_08205 [Curtobacterium citreum]